MIVRPVTPMKSSLDDRPRRSVDWCIARRLIRMVDEVARRRARCGCAAAAAGAPSRSTLKFNSTTPLFLRGTFGEP